MQPIESLSKVFSIEFDTAYFVKILLCYRFYMKNMNELKIFNRNEYQYLLDFLEQIIKIKDFKMMVPKFLNKNEKLTLKNFLSDLENTIKE